MPGTQKFVFVWPERKLQAYVLQKVIAFSFDTAIDFFVSGPDRQVL